MCTVLPQQLQTTPFRGSSKTPADQGRNPSAVMTAKATRTGMMYIRIFSVFFRSFQFLFSAGKQDSFCTQHDLNDKSRNCRRSRFRISPVPDKIPIHSWKTPRRQSAEAGRRFPPHRHGTLFPRHNGDRSPLLSPGSRASGT